MYYSFTRKELKEQKGTTYKDGDIIAVSDSHFQIHIEWGGFRHPGMCSRVYDTKKEKFQDIVIRPDYIRNFLRR